ncbi:alpha-L-fucosidase [Mucilaginibacter yixingensis]|uniref:alpha-L-fucosidase n=1 Tax=Mucilaginibacter yixingensis TaxID=1295612 RepID=A0A2T5J9F5_9SPHI|nr:alpha-L-fucosidase [Mucilaginibacter yixingensis]PTQ96639.1 alpha-L-fucosidase [Mucilaginibacter yixingensis]
MKKITSVLLSSALVAACWPTGVFAQQKTTKSEDDAVKMEHAQIGIVDDATSGYKHTTNPDAQWFSQVGFGMFIHWSIASVKALDLSWPMMAGTQIGWSSKKPTQDSVDRYVAAGNFFAGHHCETDGSCITPNQYWAMAKDFNPQSFDPDTWVRLAKEAGMKYVVFTTRHHDGFAMWPSNYGDFSTKNYLSGKDFVKDYVKACRKYGLKVGLYYSGPDWHFNRDFQSFMYYGVGRDYKNVPSLDADLHARTGVKTEAKKQQHYEEVAAYIKGQVEELLTNYGKIDMIWFDGAPDIPKGNIAWQHCITMDQIHKLQPGIVVSPRFFGYGDYKTLEGDKSLPKTQQGDWAELCATIAEPGWGYTKAPLKSTAYALNMLATCRANNANLLLNFGPTKEGVFTDEMISRLHDMAAWMKVNGVAISNTQPLGQAEQASTLATVSGKHRYLFVMPDVSNKLKAPVLPQPATTITLKTPGAVKHVSMLGNNKKIDYTANNGQIVIQVPAAMRSANGNVVDVELKD